MQHVVRPQSAAPAPWAARAPQVDGDYRGYAGKIESGRVRVGEEVVVLPRGSHAVVEAIDTPDGPLDVAGAGQSVVIRLDSDIDVSRGDILAATDAPPAPVRDLTATVCWLAERELTVGARVLVQHGTSLTKAIVKSIEGALDLDFEAGTVPGWMPDRARSRLNDIGRVRLGLASPLPIDSYREHRATGAFILVDEADGWTLGAGMAGSTPFPTIAPDPTGSDRTTPSTTRKRAIMTAPSLVLLGHGSHDPRVPQVSHQIRDGLLDIRPELDVHARLPRPLRPQRACRWSTSWSARGSTEIVFVPLLLSDAFHAQAEVPALLAQVRAAHPELRVTASRPIGPEAQLLSIIDRRLRDALRARRVCELDGLVFAAAGSSDIRSNALVARRARQWSTHHRLPCVTAFATGSGPSTAEAIRTLRAQGRRHIAVGSWFLAPGLLYTHQAELALRGRRRRGVRPDGRRAGDRRGRPDPLRGLGDGPGRRGRADRPRPS